CQSVKQISSAYNNFHPDILLNQNSFIYTTHKDGSINSWKIEYSDHKSFTSIHNVAHSFSMIGSNFNIETLTAHPVLPLVAIISCKKGDLHASYNSEIFIWRTVPIISYINTEKTWILQGSIKFKEALNFPELIWVTSIDEDAIHNVYFLITLSKGICLFQLDVFGTESCIKINPKLVLEIEAYISGIKFLGIIEKSEKIKLSFLQFKIILTKEPTDIITTSNKNGKHIHIIVGVETGENSIFINIWELMFYPKSLVNKNEVQIEHHSNDNSEQLEIGIASTSLKRFSSSFLVRFCANFNGNYHPRSWLSISNFSFSNLYETNNSIILSYLAESDEINFIELVVMPSSDGLDLSDINNHSFTFTSLKLKNSYNIVFFDPSIFFNGLNPILNKMDRESKKIFANRFAGQDSWKQEACLLIPFTDFGISDYSTKKLKECVNKMTISWCCMGNGDYLLSVVILGKILIFSPCPQKNINHEDHEDSFSQMRGSSLWALLSSSSYDYDPLIGCASTWLFTGDQFMEQGPDKLSSYIIGEDLSAGFSSSTKEKFVLKYAPPKLYELIYISYNFVDDDSSSDLNDTAPLLIPSRYEDYYDDVKMKDDSVFNHEMAEELSKFLEIATIDNLCESEMKLLSILVKISADINKIFDNEHSMDICSLQYFYAAKLNQYFIEQKNSENSITSPPILCGFHYLCAFHSHSKNELINNLNILSSTSFNWSNACLHGLGWWIHNSELKTQILETIAKCQYQLNQEPLDCALFYFLSNKKSVISTLYKSKKDSKMSTYFQQDFNEEENRLSALKNAYHLLTVHRYMHAIVFFLLVEQFWEAIQICVSNLKDLQLGFLIASFCSKNSEMSVKYIKTYLIGEAEGVQIYSDVFLRSIGFWVLGRYVESLTTLVDKFSSSIVSDLSEKRSPNLFYANSEKE
ncbi:hypothetical protein MXB_401, partial [Myxobolus squamalis]